MTTQHDNSYKLLFSHPQMVKDLLIGFVKEAWVEQLDFSTLEKVSGSYVSDELRDREDDIIWRVRWGEDWLYVYLLLEFQSSIDKYMAVRVMSYLGLLYQDLVRQKTFTPNGKLPPVLPVVLYNGETRWSAAQNVAELVEQVPGGEGWNTTALTCPTCCWMKAPSSTSPSGPTACAIWSRHCSDWSTIATNRICLVYWAHWWSGCRPPSNAG